MEPFPVHTIDSSTGGDETCSVRERVTSKRDQQGKAEALSEDQTSVNKGDSMATVEVGAGLKSSLRRRTCSAFRVNYLSQGQGES